MYKHVSGMLHLVLLVVLVGTFGSSIYILQSEPTAPAGPFAPDSAPLSVLPAAIPTSTSAPATVTPTPTETAADPPSAWTRLRPGLERRVLTVYSPANAPVEALYVWRLDQAYFRLDVAYAATTKTLDTWQKESNAVIVVNGGFYSVSNERYSPNGLTIVDGQATGRSFVGYGGMLAVKEDRAELRWLVQRPYDPGEQLQAALQAFPMLVEPGGRMGFGPERENHEAARRTVIGQDRAGRILLMVAPQGYFTLHQLSRYLTDSDLDLDLALNLDGGGSTGILVADPRELIPPTRPLPFVILVHEK